MIANNYLVIMAGGIGSRFWPYSRDRRPKQFLDFFGTGRSLLQMTVDRFRELVPVENMLVVTNIAYRDMILEQVPDLRAELVLCEPCRRNTAPCIAYATERIRALAAEKGLAEEKVRVVVAASDHLITNEREFVRVIGQGLDYVGTHDVLLTLGMRPTRPETGYGYIRVRKDAGEAITPVMAFTEKPDALRAEQFLRSGDYLWNSGMFVWNLRAIDTALGRYLPEVTAQLWAEGVYGTEREAAFIAERFPHCPSISIDYGVMEKAENVCVLPADFGWSDLGTWGSLYDLSQKDAAGNVSLHSEALFCESRGNIVTLEPGKLAVLDSLEDCIVAESEGVLLICPKDREQHIRDIVAEVQGRYQGRFV